MWCLRLNSPFGWLILSKAKPLETRRGSGLHAPVRSSGRLGTSQLSNPNTQWVAPSVGIA